MAYTIYEYDSVTNDGEPIQPPSVRSTGRASGQAYQLSKGSVYVAIVADADMYLRISDDGSAATDDDYFVSAGQTKGFPKQKPAQPYVYGLDAA